MSWIEKAWAVALPAREKLVLLAIVSHANAEGCCWPGIERLVDMTGLSRRTVLRAISTLEDVGVITVERGAGRANRYRVNAHNEPQKPVPARHQCQRDTGANQSPTSANQSQTSANVTPTSANVTPELSKNYKNKNKNKSKSNARDELALPDWLCPDDWRDWCDHRRAGRAAFTPRAQQLSLRTLARLRDDGHDPRHVIELAIERGWRGLFAPRPDTPHGGNHATHRESAAERVARINAEAEQREAFERGNVIEGSFRAR